MNVWMNKYNAELCLVHPQWEPIKIDFDEKFYNDLVPELKIFAEGRKCVHGVLIQVGWMIENKNNIWIGLPFSAADQFEDLGEA